MADHANAAASIHMVQLWLDGKKMTEVGKMLHVPLQHADNNYLAHCLLGKLFGDQAPVPFWLDDDPRRKERQRWMRFLGYSAVDTGALEEIAKAFAEPSVYRGSDWERAASKPMPVSFPAGMRLTFELRACPVVRKASDGPRWNSGQEIDAFLSAVWEIDDKTVPVEREEVYRKWLEEQLARRGGAEPVRIRLERFSIERMVRREQGRERQARTIQRPDVTLSGTLEVTDSDGFVDLLRRGIGRHTSFGFGMLKLRRR